MTVFAENILYTVRVEATDSKEYQKYAIRTDHTDYWNYKSNKSCVYYVNYTDSTNCTNGTNVVGVERYYDNASSINRAYKNDHADYAVKQSGTDSKDSVGGLVFASSARRQSEASGADSAENADSVNGTDGVGFTHK